MKKIFAMLLAIMMVFSLATVAFAAESQDATYTKVYTATNAGTISPAETFTLTYTGVSAVDASTGETLKNAEGEAVQIPEIANSTVSYAEGGATTEGAEQAITVALKDIEWPYVGIYTYNVKETAGNTAGVIYDEVVRTLKVTVAYDEGTNTYYTAFVSLTMEDANNDGITDGEKTDKIENVYQAGTLNVKKNVTGNMGDQDKVFTVKVIFNAPEGKTVNAPISYKDGDETKTITAEAMSDGTETVEITVKHDETVTFTNIPYGVTYQVIENDYSGDGYQTTYNFTWTSDTWVGQDADGYTIWKMNNAEQEMGITNHKQTTVDTGIALDSMPYILILAVAAIGLVLFTTKKRVQE